MFVPLAKLPGSPRGSITILSRPLPRETKTPLLSTSTTTPTPAWTFVSLSSKPPPVELFFPKEPENVSHLRRRRRLLPGQAERSLSVLLLKGLLAAATKAAASTPQAADPKKGALLRMILPAWTLLSAGREPSPRPLRVSRVCSLGSALAARHGEGNSFCSFWPPFLTLLWS